ncbi:MAG TPA: hypothetical protein VG820_02795 [Fimbriimonadaceae bacterium]|nr:hypothetical protein [Fimbriimonadaceae bacterium]
MRLTAFLIGLCLVGLGCGQESPPYTELTLRGDAVAAQIQKGLAGMKAEFHADRTSPDGHTIPGCFVQFGPSLGDRRFEFSLPDRVVDLGYAGKIMYKIDNVKLRSVRVEASANEFVLTAAFVSDGVTLKGSHSVLGDAAVPDIDLENMRLVVRLKPVVTTDNAISYDDPKVEFTADVDNTFIPRFTLLGHTIDVVDTLTNYRRDLCESIRKQIQRALDDPTRKAALSKKIAESISGQIAGPNSPILGLKFQGSNLVVRLRK